MLMRLARFALPRTLAGEGLYTGLWLAGLLPGLVSRAPLTVLLVVVRAGVGALQIVAAWMLMRDSPSGRPIAIATLAASAMLITFETGWRLVPTNLDPTYAWWLVAAYWIYAVVAIAMLSGGADASGFRRPQA
jgi:hypothetical protein